MTRVPRIKPPAQRLNLRIPEPLFLEPDTRVAALVNEIRDQVQPYVGQGDGQYASLDQRIIPRGDGLDGQPPDTRPCEDRFGDDRAGQHGAGLKAGNSDDETNLPGRKVEAS